MYVMKDGNNYVGKACNNYVLTDRKHSHRFKTIRNAANILRRSLPKELRENYEWTIIDELELVDQEDSNKDEENKDNLFSVNDRDFIQEQEEEKKPTYTNISIDSLKKSIELLSRQLAVMDSNKEWLMREHSRIEKEIIDLQHYIELKPNLSVCKGYKLYKLLKLMLLYRRKLKNELELTGYIKQQNMKTISSGDALKSIEGMDNRRYTPRTSDSLFKDDDINRLILLYESK